MVNAVVGVVMVVLIVDTIVGIVVIVDTVVGIVVLVAVDWDVNYTTSDHVCTRRSSSSCCCFAGGGANVLKGSEWTVPVDV